MRVNVLVQALEVLPDATVVIGDGNQLWLVVSGVVLRKITGLDNRAKLGNEPAVEVV